jgi:hypothetical protein
MNPLASVTRERAEPIELFELLEPIDHELPIQLLVGWIECYEAWFNRLIELADAKRLGDTSPELKLTYADARIGLNESRERLFECAWQLPRQKIACKAQLIDAMTRRYPLAA